MDLFGKKRLEETIRDLEARVSRLEGERDELLSTLAKRDERIKKLAYAYQEAQIACKQAEQRIKATEASGSSQETKTDMKNGLSIRPQRLAPREVLRLASGLSGLRSEKEDLFSAYLPALPEGVTPENEGFFEDLPGEAVDLYRSVSTERGAAVFHINSVFTVLLVPPFPIKERQISIGRSFVLDPLLAVLDTPVLLVLAHSGESLIGTAMSHEVFEVQESIKSPVKEKHSKGGWSQRRFERLREEDIRNHAELVAERLKPMLGQRRQLIRYAVVSGDPALTRMILEMASFPADLPVIERRLERLGRKKPEEVLEDIYGFVVYR